MGIGMALAGAAKGFGLGLMQQAEDAKKRAQKEQDRQRDMKDYKAKLDMKNAGRGIRGAIGSGGGGGSGGRALTSQERDDLARTYKSMVEGGSFKGDPPSEAEFATFVESNLDKLSISQAANLARQQWDGEATSEPITEERGKYSPARIAETLLGRDPTDEVGTRVIPAPGFGRQSPQPTTTPSTQPAAAQPGGLPRPRTRAEMEALPSGTRFIDPQGNERVKP